MAQPSRLFPYFDFTLMDVYRNAGIKSMPFTKLSALLPLVFGKVEGILIIPLEKWKFVHKLR